MATLRRQDDGRWFVRYRDPDRQEHVRTFDRKSDAQRFIDKVAGDMMRGDYIDPSAGKVTFGEYASLWRDAQVHRETTKAQVESHLKHHILPFSERRRVGSVRP